MRRSAKCCPRSPTMTRPPGSTSASSRMRTARSSLVAGCRRRVGAEPRAAEEPPRAARRLLAGLAHERPLLIVLEDVHWAAPAFLDLVESLVELGTCPAARALPRSSRPAGLRPHWGGGRLSSSSVLLDVLTAEESDALLDRLCSKGRSSIAARERILAVAEGNPLFIEQLLAAALEGEAEAVPDSIQTLLAARLDRLDEGDRAVGAGRRRLRDFVHDGEEVAELVEGDPRPPC